LQDVVAVDRPEHRSTDPVRALAIPRVPDQRFDRYTAGSRIGEALDDVDQPAVLGHVDLGDRVGRTRGELPKIPVALGTDVADLLEGIVPVHKRAERVL